MPLEVIPSGSKYSYKAAIQHALMAPEEAQQEHSIRLQLATTVLLVAASAIYRLQVKGSVSSALIATALIHPLQAGLEMF